jgi:hypothetical protein
MDESAYEADPGGEVDHSMDQSSFDPSTYGSSAAMYQSYPSVQSTQGPPMGTPANTQAMGPASAGNIATAQPNMLVYIIAAVVIYYLVTKKG